MSLYHPHKFKASQRPCEFSRKPQGSLAHRLGLQIQTPPGVSWQRWGNRAKYWEDTEQEKGAHAQCLVTGTDTEPQTLEKRDAWHPPWVRDSRAGSGTQAGPWRKSETRQEKKEESVPSTGNKTTREALKQEWARPAADHGNRRKQGYWRSQRRVVCLKVCWENSVQQLRVRPPEDRNPLAKTYPGGGEWGIWPKVTVLGEETKDHLWSLEKKGWHCMRGDTPKRKDSIIKASRPGH